MCLRYHIEIWTSNGEAVRSFTQRVKFIKLLKKACADIISVCPRIFFINAVYHLQVYPPSTATMAPVIQLASSLARTTAILAMSMGFPGPLNGYISFMVS